MEELRNYRHRLLDRLETVVDDLRAAWDAVPPGAQHTPHGPESRTPYQTIAHLRDIESHALSVRLRCILDENCPQLALFDDGGWQEDHGSSGEDPQAILDEYAHLRAEELRWLRTCPPESWNRLARHPWYGLRTLQWWVERCLEYAETHVTELKTSQV